MICDVPELFFPPFKGPGNRFDASCHGLNGEILSGNLAGSAKKLQLGHDWIIQQDSDPKHASKFTRKCFISHRIKSKVGNLWFKLKNRSLEDLERWRSDVGFRVALHSLSSIVGLNININHQNFCSD